MTLNHGTQMHNPPHPGELIEGVYLEPCGLSIRQVAERLDVSASTLQRLIAGKSRVSPDMALRLSRVLGRSAESWLTLQDSHNQAGPPAALPGCGAHHPGASGPPVCPPEGHARRLRLEAFGSRFAPRGGALGHFWPAPQQRRAVQPA